MKKLFKFLFCLGLIFCISSLMLIKKAEAGMVYCPDSPLYSKQHQMRYHGGGILKKYDPSTGEQTTIFQDGSTYQCKNCNYLVVMQDFTDRIGYYASHTPLGETTWGMTVLSVEGKDIHYSSGTTLAGCVFY